MYTSIEFCPTDAKGRLSFWCKPSKMSFEQMIFFTIDLTRPTVGNVTACSNGRIVPFPKLNTQSLLCISPREF